MIVFAVCIHIKTLLLLLLPQNVQYYALKVEKSKIQPCRTSYIQLCTYLIFIRYLKKEKKMTTPPTRFHQNNKIIRYIRKTAKIILLFNYSALSLYHPTFLGIYEKKLIIPNFLEAKLNKFTAVFLNKKKILGRAATLPFLENI